MPLGESPRALEEAHDLTTIGPANDGKDAFKILMGKNCKEVRLVHNFSLPTFSATSIEDENWVKGFFFMVPHEEYETSTSPFDYDMTIVPSYLHLQQQPLLHTYSWVH